MTPEREAKHVQRVIRNIPVDQVAPQIAAEEEAMRGMWCIVAGEFVLVLAAGGQTFTNWDDPVAHALYVRYVQAHPERIHASHDEAVAFVRSRLADRDGS